jgi:hypothetical protein
MNTFIKQFIVYLVNFLDYYLLLNHHCFFNKRCLIKFIMINVVTKLKLYSKYLTYTQSKF